MVTKALPPRSSLTNASRSVVTVSWKKTSSLKGRGTGPGSVARATVASLLRVVTTPAGRGCWAQASAGKRAHAGRASR